MKNLNTMKTLNNPKLALKRTLLGLTMSAALISPTMANLDLSEYAGQYFKQDQDRHYIFQLLGTVAYYDDNCEGMSLLGSMSFHKMIAISGATVLDIAENEDFNKGYSRGNYFECQFIYDQFENYGLQDNLNAPKALKANDVQ